MFPSRHGSLPPASVSGLLRRQRIRSLNEKWTLSSPCFSISTLPRWQPPARLSLEIFRRELAITELDWPFTPSPRSTERIARHHPFGPPPGFRPASPCPRLDHSVSSFIHVISDPLRSRSSRLATLRTCWFPYGCELLTLSLTTKMNSPARGTKRNAQPWSPLLRTAASPRFPSEGIYPFGLCTTVTT